MKCTAVLLLLGLGIASGLQTPAKPTFEVATVRAADPNPANTVLVGISADPSVVRYRNLTLRDAIRGAYKVRDFQIVGPDWMATARFEVDAIAAAKGKDRSDSRDVSVVAGRTIETARRFYLRHEFIQLAEHPPRLLIAMKTIQKAFA